MSYGRRCISNNSVEKFESSALSKSKSFVTLVQYIILIIKMLLKKHSSASITHVQRVPCSTYIH